MSLEQEIMVVDRKKLFRDRYFQGYNPSNLYNFESIIIDNSKFMVRALAEENPDYKQPIAYAVIINEDTKQIFGYVRSKKDKDYREKRLQGKFSIGFGGHINRHDLGFDAHPIKGSLIREVFREELDILGNAQEPQLLGYINDDTNAVGKVHFGLLYYVLTNAKTIKAKDKEIADSRFYRLSQLVNICNDSKRDVEGWTKIALEPISEILKDEKRLWKDILI